MVLETSRWDVAEHLDSSEAIAAYLDAVLEDGHPELIKAALGDIARAKGMTAMAETAGISRSGLYKALGEGGNPTFDTVLKIIDALSVRLSAAPRTA